MRLNALSKALATGALLLLATGVQAVATTTQMFTPQSVTVTGNTPFRSAGSPFSFIEFRDVSPIETFTLTLPDLTGLTLDSIDITVSSKYDVKVGGFSLTGGPVDVSFRGAFFLNAAGAFDTLIAPSGRVQGTVIPGDIFAEEQSFPGSGFKVETRSFSGADMTALLSNPFGFSSSIDAGAVDLPFVVLPNLTLVEATLSSSLKVTYNTSPIVAAQVPVPASLPLMLAGLAGLGWVRGRALSKGA